MDAAKDPYANGVCPAATEAVVFSDADGKWKGRYRDESGKVHDIPLVAISGPDARQLLARYLGLLSVSVLIVEVHYKSRKEDSASGGPATQDTTSRQ